VPENEPSTDETELKVTSSTAANSIMTRAAAASDAVIKLRPTEVESTIEVDGTPRIATICPVEIGFLKIADALGRDSQHAQPLKLAAWLQSSQPIHHRRGRSERQRHHFGQLSD
tara:strand:- start:120 stop:461 length:342 start_codon:yes stop_codon:yes gene_type:complete